MHLFQIDPRFRKKSGWNADAECLLNETLKREQPFVMSVPASEADPSYPEDETILVQGIIDAWFPEGDEIVLVDYKTDRVKEVGELKSGMKTARLLPAGTGADDRKKGEREDYLFAGFGRRVGIVGKNY